MRILLIGEILGLIMLTGFCQCLSAQSYVDKDDSIKQRIWIDLTNRLTLSTSQVREMKSLEQLMHNRLDSVKKATSLLEDRRKILLKTLFGQYQQYLRLILSKDQMDKYEQERKKSQQFLWKQNESLARKILWNKDE